MMSLISKEIAMMSMISEKAPRDGQMLHIRAICQREEEENCSFFSWIGILCLGFIRLHKMYINLKCN
jgi:hypothetical protein